MPKFKKGDILELANKTWEVVCYREQWGVYELRESPFSGILYSCLRFSSSDVEEFGKKINIQKSHPLTNIFK